MKTSVSLLAVLALCWLALATPAVAGGGATAVFYVGATPGGFAFSASPSMTNPFGIPAVNPGGLVAAIFSAMFDTSPIYTSYTFVSATTGKSVRVPILGPEHHYTYSPGGEVTDVVTYHTSEEQWELIRYALGSLFPSAPQGGGATGGGGEAPPPVDGGGGTGPGVGGAASPGGPTTGAAASEPAGMPVVNAGQLPDTASYVGWTPAPAIVSIAGGQGIPGLEKEKSSCFSRNRFASLFAGTSLEPVITVVEITSLVSLAGDLGATGIKATRTGFGGPKQAYASGLNAVFRRVGRAAGSRALTGTLIAIGDAATPVLAVTGTFLGAYDATIFAQCRLDIIK